MEIFTIIFTCALVSTLVSGLIVRYGKKLGIMDDPKTHIHPKVVHTHPVPRGGGLPILASLVVGTILWMPQDVKVVGILGGALIIGVWGWLDDKNEEMVSPVMRLVFDNVAAALAVVGTGIGIAYISNPFGSGVINLDTVKWCFELFGSSHCVWVLADVFAVVWLVWMQNVVGWSSGVDGQLPGFVVVAAITMLAIAFRFTGQSMVITLGAITAGAFIGFWPWNWWPQKMMPGYGGKSLAGYLLGILAILSFGKVGAMIMVLGVPFVDAIMVIYKRLKEGRSIFVGGKEHLHHYLLDMGWSKPKIAVFYTAMSGAFGFLALTLQAEAKLFTMAAVALILGGLILWLQNWSIYSKQQDPDNG